MKKLLFLLPVALLLAGCSTNGPVQLASDAAISGGEAVFYTGNDTSTVDDEAVVVVPTTGSVSVTFDAQPTKLAGSYSGNGAMLRAWASENVKTLDVPANAKNIKIGFKFAKVSKYDAIPGNLQLSVGVKHLCNGRLTNKSATVDGDTATYWYDFTNVSTQDKPKGVDLSYAVGKTLVVKVWIGENKNYIEEIVLNYDLQ